MQQVELESELVRSSGGMKKKGRKKEERKKMIVGKALDELLITSDRQQERTAQ